MGSKKQYSKAKRIPLIQQKVALLAAYPDGKCDIGNRKKLIWSGKIRPTPISQEYTVVLTWELGWSPKVWVIGDELQRLDDPDFPHKYQIIKEEKMVRLCLYRHQEFSSYEFLSKTIIPWTVEWLYFYEIWLVTGEWCGGGEHPQVGEQKAEETA